MRSLLANRITLFVTSILSVIFLIGFFTAISKPVESQQQTALLNYQQQGSFDYSAYMKPSYLYGPTPTTTQTTTQYALPS